MGENLKQSNFLTSEAGSVDVIDLIRKHRNDLIKDFLDERYLMEYLQSQYKVIELSNIKIEFIKKDLKQLMIAPVDLIHYKPVIDGFKTTGSISLAGGNEEYFYKEIEGVLKGYLYS